MSPSAYITVRLTKSGKRFVVRYRVGGRYSKLVHAGSFKTQKAARDRRDFVIGELAAGRNPIETLRALEDIAPVRTYRQVAAAYRASRVDHADGTSRNTASQIKKLAEVFGDRDPLTMTVADQVDGVAKLAKELAPATLRAYWAQHRLILDYAGADPNPARDRKVKLPKVVQEEPTPPTAKQFLRILELVPAMWRLPFVLMEQTALTIGEIESLTWGDVDVAGCQLRIRRGNVKAAIRSRARWPQVPEWLMEILDDTLAVEDRTAERRVFPGFVPNRARDAMGRACKTAGIPHFHPHDLRHRRLSLWHGQGVPAKQLAERAGHSRASMTLDVYSHVLLDQTEASPKSLEHLLVRSR